MKLKLLNLLTILYLFFDSTIFPTTANVESPCGDWEQYKDEHCYKLFDSVQSYSEAEKVCQTNNSTLVSIHYAEEQDFLKTYIFSKKKAVDNVWIGAKFTNNSLHRWEDNTTLDGASFSNWATGNPKNLADHCVEILAVEGSEGKWADEKCAKRNLPLCQRMPIPSIWLLSKAVIDLKHNFEKVSKELGEVKDKTIPIGFIYVQLPKNKAPGELWPSMSWTDVSSQYDGVFFRVVGGKAASFGTVQDYNAPRLESVQNYVSSNHGSESNDNEGVPQTGWSENIFTGGYMGASVYLRFKNSDISEVRPVNMAIKVFQRTG